ncbi:MAG: hypothetical protein P8Y66_11305 [Nitrospirota bacterium]|jgi:hypothetical protein
MRQWKPYTMTSRITGKVVQVRHALEADVPRMKELLGRFGREPAVRYEGYVIAEEEDRLLGLGRMEDTPGGGARMEVLVEKKQGFVSELIVKHLVEEGREKAC